MHSGASVSGKSKLQTSHVFSPDDPIFVFFFKKNLNAPRPSEHIPQSGGEMSKRLGGIIGCKYKRVLF